MLCQMAVEGKPVASIQRRSYLPRMATVVVRSRSLYLIRGIQHNSEFSNKDVRTQIRTVGNVRIRTFD